MTSESDKLDAFFDAARADAGPDAALMARVMADAASVAETPQAPVAAPRPWSLRITEAIGGWIGVSGLAAACAAGIAIGTVLPDTIDSATEGGLSAVLGLSAVGGYADFGAVDLADGWEGLE